MNKLTAEEAAAWMREAMELIDEGISYTPAYYRDKWHMVEERNGLARRAGLPEVTDWPDK